MNFHKAGQFLGHHNQTISFDDLLVTETEYDYKFIDWHYHENPYFSFVTKGHCRDSNRHESFECTTDSLLFYNCQEPHFNTKTDGTSRGFQLELNREWCEKFEIDRLQLPATTMITHPGVRLLFYNIYKEAKLLEKTAKLTIDALLLETVALLQGVENFSAKGTPSWVKKADEILHDSFGEPFSLLELSNELRLHPAHLSRDFRKYFRCNFSEYVRKIKVEKSLSLLRNKKLSLTEIGMNCGFTDQSHFIRCFKEFNRITPTDFRKLIN